MNLRTAITRTLTYTNVEVSFEGETYTYQVPGKTTAKKELLKALKKYEGTDIPTVKVEVVEERRAISLEDFIANSIIIEDQEDGE